MISNDGSSHLKLVNADIQTLNVHTMLWLKGVRDFPVSYFKLYHQ